MHRLPFSRGGTAECTQDTRQQAACSAWGAPSRRASAKPCMALHGQLAPPRLLQHKASSQLAPICPCAQPPFFHAKLPGQGRVVACACCEPAFRLPRLVEGGLEHKPICCPEAQQAWRVRHGWVGEAACQPDSAQSLVRGRLPLQQGGRELVSAHGTQTMLVGWPC